MNRDGNRVSDSTVVLMTVAVVYKFVLVTRYLRVILGFGILFFWHGPLREYLNRYFPLYILGLMLNVILVILILGVMLFPNVILKTAKFFENILIRMKVWKHRKRGKKN